MAHSLFKDGIRNRSHQAYLATTIDEGSTRSCQCCSQSYEQVRQVGDMVLACLGGLLTFGRFLISGVSARGGSTINADGSRHYVRRWFLGRQVFGFKPFLIHDMTFKLVGDSRKNVPGEYQGHAGSCHHMQQPRVKLRLLQVLQIT
jgi:hypothetical protein